MDQPLYTKQLDHILKPMGGIFKGTYPSDELPNCQHFTFPWCLIANTDCSHKPGAHWIGIYFDTEQNGHYFDSYGMAPTKRKWLQFLTRNSRSGYWDMQRRKIQSEWSPFCGHYVAYYLLARHLCPLSVSDYKLMLHVNDSNILDELDLILKQYSS